MTKPFISHVAVHTALKAKQPSLLGWGMHINTGRALFVPKLPYKRRPRRLRCCTGRNRYRPSGEKRLYFRFHITHISADLHSILDARSVRCQVTLSRPHLSAAGRLHPFRSAPPVPAVSLVPAGLSPQCRLLPVPPLIAGRSVPFPVPLPVPSRVTRSFPGMNPAVGSAQAAGLSPPAVLPAVPV